MNAVLPAGRPEIGQWYLHQDKGEMFLVTAFDDDARTIEIQNFDGDVDEIEAETWSAMPLERAAPPEDWTGPLDDVEVDDLGVSETDMSAADWAEPLQSFEPSMEAWEDETPEEDRDSEGEGDMAEQLSVDRPDSLN